MDDESLVRALRTATAAMGATVRGADPHAPVPACPGWSVTDLVDHLGRVHLWAAHCARHGAPPDPYPRRDREQPLPDWYAATADTVVGTLAELSPDHPSWSFSAVPGHQDVRFWRRRQLHETTVHHVDALQAGGLLPTTGLVDRIPGMTTEQAADGVTEVFEVMAPRSLVRHADRPPLEVVPAGEPIAFACTDTDASWTVGVVDGAVRVIDSVAQEAVARVRGPASHLYLALWHRADSAVLVTDGDEAAARRLLAAALVP
ncbi:maleylpyruvate isomerase N-terminal domain-containing protein [Pedococcus bigeumensis]|uniref:Maleylpyruvate isomerase family mycothiol-dependent enzyme n=1 Tax=Pedococcus bigeumensis TaxID=433644 RepID=A0A502CZJ7_9MICO|nr:maleylpyruvate isomerase N-terminal domain-containing protein [Pedococcus bigeumensis]TPG18328.1 maleylpyruvate isomerase family mycothiol-dependent enzyme [Pedococcus bigeumensis]